jgi:hypothetical protein
MTWREPFRPTQYRFWPVGPGPFTANPLDSEGRQLIEHIRSRGCLPGRGALEPWGVDHIHEFSDAVELGYSPRAARRAVKADRRFAVYLSDEQLAKFAAKEREHEAAQAAKAAELRERMRKREADEAERRAELRAERERWKQARNRERVLPEERRARWAKESIDWDNWEQQQRTDAERRRYVKLLRRQPSQTVLHQRKQVRRHRLLLRCSRAEQKRRADAAALKAAATAINTAPQMPPSYETLAHLAAARQFVANLNRSREADAAAIRQRRVSFFGITKDNVRQRHWPIEHPWGFVRQVAPFGAWEYEQFALGQSRPIWQIECLRAAILYLVPTNPTTTELQQILQCRWEMLRTALAQLSAEGMIAMEAACSSTS